MQDHHIQVFDIAYLEDEVIDRFTSDFKIVARFFKQKRISPDAFCLEDDTTVIKHVEAVMDLLRVFTKDSRYAELYKEALESKVKKGEAVTMCEVADAYIRKGWNKGKLEGKITAIIELVRDGDLPIEKAAAKLGLSEEEIRNRLTELD